MNESENIEITADRWIILGYICWASEAIERDRVLDKNRTRLGLIRAAVCEHGSGLGLYNKVGQARYTGESLLSLRRFSLSQSGFKDNPQIKRGGVIGGPS